MRLQEKNTINNSAKKRKEILFRKLKRMKSKDFKLYHLKKEKRKDLKRMLNNV